MVEFATNEFFLESYVEGTTSKWRDQLKQTERINRRPEPALHVECPPTMAYLWNLYWDIRWTTKAGKSVLDTFAECKAWTELTGIVLTRDELKAIKAIDRELFKSAPKN